MTKQTIYRAAAVLSAALLTAVSVPASAAEGDMTFRMAADNVYFTESALASADAVVSGGMYIDNYTGITSMKIRLMSDEPLIIENGDFTRDPSRTETEGTATVAKQCYFVSHGSTTYTRYSAADGQLKNIALWYGPGSVVPEAGVVEDADSSFLSFDIRIPQGTPAGVYRCYISDGYEILESGMKSPDLFVYDGSGDRTEVALEDCEIIVEPAAMRGDVDCNGVVDVLDAQSALQYYATVTLGHMGSNAALIRSVLRTPYVHTAIEAADILKDGSIDLIDTMAILRYYADGLSHLSPVWEDYI